MQFAVWKGVGASRLPRQAKAVAIVVTVVLVVGMAALVADVGFGQALGGGDGLAGSAGSDASAASDVEASESGAAVDAGDAASASTESFASVTYVEGVWSLIKEGASLDEAMRESGFLPVSCAADLPQWMREEVLSLEGCSAAFANDDFSVVGFVEGGERDEVLGRLLSELSSKGWSPYGDSYADVVSLIKEKGDCRWLMLECVDLEGEESVVLHIARD